MSPCLAIILKIHTPYHMADAGHRVFVPQHDEHLSSNATMTEQFYQCKKRVSRICTVCRSSCLLQRLPRQRHQRKTESTGEAFLDALASYTQRASIQARRHPKLGSPAHAETKLPAVGNKHVCNYSLANVFVALPHTQCSRNHTRVANSSGIQSWANTNTTQYNAITYSRGE